MEHDIYRQLMKHLGNVGVGYPQIGDFLEVLRKTVTLEEAEVALGLPTGLLPFEVERIEEIAFRTDKSIEETEETLEKLARKGYLYKGKTKSGKVGYAFIQIGIGFPQIFYWKGEITEQVKEIAQPVAKSMAEKVDSQKQLFRYVPVNKAVDRTLQAILPFDMMTEVVNKAKKIAVASCPCRMGAQVLEDRKCTHSLETCMKFNEMAEFILEKGYGRELSKDEALETLRKCEEEGLIHLVDNCQEEIQNCCNCCSCCCWNVMPIKNRLVSRDYIMATYYLRTTDEQKCIGCGQCADDCPLEIITMEDDLPVVDESICIGCGVCLLHCPSEAAKLKKKDESTPLGDFYSLQRTAIKKARDEARE